MTFDADSECEECEEDSFADDDVCDGTLFFTVNIYFQLPRALALLLPRVLSLSFGRLERESQVLCARVCIYEMMCDVYILLQNGRERMRITRQQRAFSLLSLYYIYTIYTICINSKRLSRP